MRGGQARRHGQGRKEREEREHGLDAFARGHDAARFAEAHRVAEQITHGAARIGKRRFAGSVAIEPGPLQPGQISVKIGDRADQGGPALAGRAFMGAVITGGMKAKALPVKAGGDGASAQIGFGQRAGHGPRQAIELPGGGQGVVGRLDRPDLARCADMLGLAQESPGFRKGFAAILQVFVEPDEVEKIAMLSRCGVGPVAGVRRPKV